MGVDVSAEMDDALRYSQKYPSLSEEFSKDEAITSQDWGKQLFRRLRSTAADLGGRTLRRRINAYQLTQKLKRGPMRSGFAAYGEDFGFNDIVGMRQIYRSYCSIEPRKRRYVRGIFAPMI